MDSYIAVDIGGTQIRTALYPPEGILPTCREKTTTRGLNQAAIDRTIEMIARVWPADGTVKAIGVSAPGPLDPYQGVIVAAPNMPGWTNFPLQAILEERFHVPVILGHDANLATIAEWKFGAAQGYSSVMYLTLSTGIGGGVIDNGHLILGGRGMATELGHLTIDPNGPTCTCGGRGHLEMYTAGPAIAGYVLEQIRAGRPSSLPADPPPDAAAVNEAACQGDALALEAIQRAGRWLGISLANFLASFNPQIIVLGGGVSQCGENLLEPARAAMRQYAMAPQYLENLVLTTAALGGDVSLLGALYMARQLDRVKDLRAVASLNCE